MKHYKFLPFLLLLFIVPFQSHAWGLLGHRVVGQIAELYLTPKAKKAIKDILGGESLAMNANWADFIKSDTSYRYLSSWHYLDFPDSMNYQQVRSVMDNDTTPNVYNKTNWLVKQLKNKSLPRDKKLFYLRLLVHFIGDMHQPLHHGRVVDEGGNKVRVTWFGDSTNLHTVWDTRLIEDQKLSYTEYAEAINHHITAADIAKLQKQPISEWVYESYVISRDIYKDVPRNGRLSYYYNFKWIETANGRLLKGGVRLAGLLNEIFK
jgi:hypothetical protein